MYSTCVHKPIFSSVKPLHSQLFEEGGSGGDGTGDDSTGEDGTDV